MIHCPWSYKLIFYDVAGSLSLDNLVYLFVCLFIKAVSKRFFKMHLLLQICTDPYDIRHESSLRGPAFCLCSAWRYGAFGDLATINKMVLYIVTQQISL